jgi:hypothetical protein
LTYNIYYATIIGRLVDLAYGVPRWNFWLGHYKKGTDIMTDRKFLGTLYFSMFLSGVGIALAIVASYCRVDEQTNTVATAHENPPGLIGYNEIGWRPVVGEMNKDPESGVHYVIVSINGRTNDILSQRVCYINLGATSTWSDFSWYDEATLPPVWKVYVVSRRTEPMNQTVFFVKNDATNPKYNLIPTKK